MNYILTTVGTAGILLTTTAALNWIVDPAEIFQKTSFGQQYAKTLLESKHGLVLPDSLDEREFKAVLAKNAAQFHCVVIGSSHVMQISSARKHRSLPDCKNILNLGVSGAGIEDHFALTWMALSGGKPGRLILGVDPWTLAYGKDERWKIRYAEEYHAAWTAIDGAKKADPTSSNRWSSLISAGYTKRSLGFLWRGATKPSIEIVQSVDEEIGGKHPVTLQDGSHIYSSEYIAESRNIPIPIGGTGYKVDGVVNVTSAITAYKGLVKWIRSQGVEPVLLMTPYHQNVWKLATSPNVGVMIATENIVRKMGIEIGVPVVGSYRPEVVGCTPDEFYDFMHPKASCVAKISH